MRNFIIIVLFAFLYISNVSAQGSLSSGLVLYLPFNGNTLDVTTGKHHAINIGATSTTGIAGIPNTAYYFNGSAHMNVAHHSDLNPYKFSICAKVKVQGFYSGFCYNNIIMSKGWARNPGAYSLQHSQTYLWDCNVEDISRHNYRIDVQNVTIPLPATMETKPYLIKDEWDCVVGTFDGDTAKLYVNGVFRFKYYEPSFTPNMEDIYIGYIANPGYPFYFTGSMDEIRVYNRVLSASEVADYCSYTTPDNTLKANFKDSASSCFTKQFIDMTTFTTTPVKFWIWTFGDGSSSTLPNPVHTYSAPGSYNVKLVVIDSNGYVDSTSKTIKSTPIIANAGRDTGLCRINGSATTLLKGSRGGASYSWTPDTGGLSHSSSSSTYATITEPTYFVYKVTDSMGCTDTDTVFVDLYPETKVIAGPKDTSVCKSTPFMLIAKGAKTYSWSPSETLDTPSKYNPLAQIEHKTTFTVKGIDSNGCIGYDSLIVNVLPSIKVSANPNNLSGCFGDKIMLNAAGATSYRWIPSEGLSNDTISNPELIINGTFIYIVKGSSDAGCSEYDTVIINQYPAPVVNAYSDNNIIGCQGKGVQLNVSGALNYAWSPEEYCSDKMGASTIVNPPTTTVFTVKGTNEYGCSATDTISVIYDGQSLVYVPNAFTPNNDDINDKIRIIDNCNFRLIFFNVYNRWGQKVFETHSLSSSWDGTFNGKACETGVYYYLIKGNDLSGKELLFKGDISLLR